MPEPTQGTLFIDDVTTVDCAIFDPARGVLGQSWHVDIELTGALDDQGFVYDFSLLKKLVRATLKSSIDHSLIIPVASQGVDFSEDENGEVWNLRANCKLSRTDFCWRYECPKGAVFPINAICAKTPLVEEEIHRLIKHRLPNTVDSMKIHLREESAEPTAAFFRYTHGIDLHEGLCQRLFHGHRSRIEVYVDDNRRPDIEHYVASDLFHGNTIHICSSSQVQSEPMEFGMRGVEGKQVELAYRGTKGEYRGRLPAERTFLVEGETSIESIATQLAKNVKARLNAPGDIKVKVFEGIGKGAIGYS